MPASIEHRIATELNVAERQVAAAVRLLDEGATVPFIARYRKEVTDGLDDTQLRTLEDRLGYLRELDDRRASILESIDSQGNRITSYNVCYTKLLRVRRFGLKGRYRSSRRCLVSRITSYNVCYTKLLREALLTHRRHSSVTTGCYLLSKQKGLDHETMDITLVPTDAWADRGGYLHAA